MMDTDALNRIAMANAAASLPRDGEWARNCVYKYRDTGLCRPCDYGKKRFAQAVICFCLEELLGAHGAQKRATPTVCWFADSNEHFDFGCDTALAGYYDSPDDTIYLYEGLRPRRLVETAAHEACHAAKHRFLGSGWPWEKEAIAFGAEIAARYGIPGDEPVAALVAVPAGQPLPSRALTYSYALDCAAAAIYRNDGTLRAPRWINHSQLKP